MKKITKKIVTIIVFSAMIFNTACTTMMNGTNEEIVVNSEPEDALVEFNGQEYTTPAKILVKRKAQIDFLVSKEGYEEKHISLSRKISWWLAGDIGIGACTLIGGIIGVAVDFGNGSVYTHDPNPLFVVLDPLPKIKSAATKEKELKKEKVDTKIEKKPELIEEEKTSKPSKVKSVKLKTVDPEINEINPVDPKKEIKISKKINTPLQPITERNKKNQFIKQLVVRNNPYNLKTKKENLR